MRRWVDDIREMHEKFFGSLRDRVREMTPEARRAFWEFRVAFVQEEAGELAGAKTPEDAVDALVDVCVVAIGTMDAFGVDAEDAWLKVCLANLKKVTGMKPSRENGFNLPDLVKPEGWTGPDHSGNVGMINDVFDHGRAVQPSPVEDV